MTTGGRSRSATIYYPCNTSGWWLLLTVWCCSQGTVDLNFGLDCWWRCPKLSCMHHASMRQQRLCLAMAALFSAVRVKSSANLCGLKR